MSLDIFQDPCCFYVQVHIGPIRTPSWGPGKQIRGRFDYEPAVCKDFKETGCCGFGGEIENIAHTFFSKRETWSLSCMHT
jgi:hypothetical protein